MVSHVHLLCFADDYDNADEQQPKGLQRTVGSNNTDDNTALRHRLGLSSEEFARVTSLFNSLQEVGSGKRQAPSQPPNGDQGITRGSGPGGAGGVRKCGRCEKHAGLTVLYAGHDCLLYLISIGKDPRQYPHTQEAAERMVSLPTAEQARQLLARKKAKSVQTWTNGKKKRKLSTMSCPSS